MGTLATRINHIDAVSSMIKSVLEHFDQVSLKATVAKQLSAAADIAFSDPILLEKRVSHSLFFRF